MTATQPVHSFLCSSQFERSDCPLLEAGGLITIGVVLEVAQPEASPDPRYERFEVSRDEVGQVEVLGEG